MTRPSLLDTIAAAQAARLAESRRSLRIARPIGGARVVIEGRELIDVASNDYLGLAFDPRVRAALADAARDQAGARASHLLGGHHPEHAALEAELAAWLGYPRVLLFSTGYMAAVGALSALLSRFDLALQDRLNHACLLDGARLAGARLLRYAHGDVSAAAAALDREPDRRALLITDSVFSMDGDIAPLCELAELARAENAALMVDEAHAIGVLGPQGRGACAAAGLRAEHVPVLMLTFGKAFGVSGAAIVCSTAIADALLHGARSFIYTTALPPAIAAAIRAAMRRVIAGDDLRAHLADRIAQFRAGATELGLPLLPSTTAIQPLMLGDSRAALDASRRLAERGVYCPAIRPPTVPRGQARLRLSLSAALCESDVEQLLAALAATLKPEIRRP